MKDEYGVATPLEWSGWLAATPDQVTAQAASAAVRAMSREDRTGLRAETLRMLDLPDGDLCAALLARTHFFSVMAFRGFTAWASLRATLGDCWSVAANAHWAGRADAPVMVVAAYGRIGGSEGRS